MKKSAMVSLFCCLFFVQLWAAPQKIYLFLKQPIENSSIVVHLKDVQQDFNSFQIQSVSTAQVTKTHQISYNKLNSKRAISLVLQNGGAVKLDVFDLHGKRVARLVDAVLRQGTSVFYEEDSWLNFTKFRGVAFFVLTVDNVTVLRQMVPKVE